MWIGKNGQKIITLLCALTLLSLVPLWINEYAPLQDYPAHLLNVQIIRNYTSAEFDYSKNFEINFPIVTNFAFEIITLAMAMFLPLYVAGKITLSIYLILFPLSVAYLIYQADKNRLTNALIAPAISYNWFFTMGFVNFVLGIPLVFFSLGYWWKIKEMPSKKQLIVLTVLVTMTFFTHIIDFAVLAFSIAVMAIMHHHSIKKISLQLMPMLPAAMLLLYKTTTIVSVSKYLPVYRPQYLMDFIFWAFSSFSKIEALVVIALVVIYYSFFSSTILKKQRIENREFLTLTFALIVLYLLLPFATIEENARNVNYFSFWPINARLIIFWIIIPLAVVKIPQKFNAAFAALSIVLLATSLIGIRTGFQESNKYIEIYLRGMEKIGPEKTIMPYQPLCTDYGIVPLEHTYAFYHIEKGGISPFLFAKNDYDLIKFRNGAFMHDINYLDVGQFDYAITCDETGKLEKALNLGAYPLIFNEGWVRIYEIKDNKDENQKINP